MQRDDQQYFIEPLWNVTIKSDQPHPHVIYQQDTDTYFSLILLAQNKNSSCKTKKKRNILSILLQ